MSDSEKQFVIRTAIDPTGVGPGEARTVEGIESIETAAAKAQGAMAAMAEGPLLSLEEYQASLTAAAAATDENAAGLSRARQIANEYGISIVAAAHALALLGEEQASAAIGSAELDAAVESAMRSTTAASAALSERVAAQRAVVEAEMAAIEAEDALAASGGTLAGISETLAAALERQGIAQAEVAATAVKMNTSYEAAGRAMIAIKNAELATEVARVRAELEAATAATDENAAATEASAVANDLDAEALAKRAIMMRRTSDGLVDLAMGGRRAVQGVSDLQYVLTSLIPEGAAAFAVLGGIALVGEIWERTSRKMAQDHHEAMEKIKADHDDLVKTLKAGYEDEAKAAALAAEAVGKSYELQQAKIDALISSTKELQRAQDELNDARLAAQIAQLDNQEEQAEQGKSPEEVAQIKRQFDEQRLNLRQQAALSKAADDVDSSGQDLITAKLALKDKSDKLQRAQSDLITAQAKAATSPVSVDSDLVAAQKQRDSLQSKVDAGKASGDDVAALQTLLATLPSLQAKQDAAGGKPQYDNQLADLQKQLEEAQKQQKADVDAVNSDDNNTAAGRAMRLLDTEGAQKSLDKVNELQRQIAQVAARQSNDAALIEAQKTFAEAQGKAAPEIVKLTASIEAATLRLQTALQKASTLTVVDATAAQKQGDQGDGADAKGRKQPPPLTGDQQAQAEEVLTLNAQAAARKRDQGAEITTPQIEALKLQLADAMKGTDHGLVASLVQQLGALQAQARAVQADANRTGDVRPGADANDELHSAVNAAHAALDQTGSKPLADALNNLGQTAQNHARLTADLAAATDFTTKAIIQRLIAAEDAVRSLERRSQSLSGIGGHQ